MGWRQSLRLPLRRECGLLLLARAHGMWTWEPRQGRKAATVLCSASAVVTLAFPFTTGGGPFTILCWLVASREIANTCLIKS
jgi:hypothetical protein